MLTNIYTLIFLLVAMAASHQLCNDKHCIETSLEYILQAVKLANSKNDKDNETECLLALPTNCKDIVYANKNSVSGIYDIRNAIDGSTKQVYCDMETSGGGWMTIQRRLNGHVNFYRNWEAYRYGFGDVEGNVWLGNEFVYRLTNYIEHELLIVIQNWHNVTRYAKYAVFRLDSNDNYFKLTISGYSGTAGDSLIRRHAGSYFTTFDQDHDTRKEKNCAEWSHGGWWFADCEDSSLNGLYYSENDNSNVYFGLSWDSFGGEAYSHKFCEMKIRPKY